MSAEVWTPVTWVHREDCVADALAVHGVLSNGCICGNSLRGYAFRLPSPLPVDPAGVTA